MPLTAEVSKRGLITIPKALREANNIQEGQQYSVHDLGGGALLFNPKASRIDQMCDDLRAKLLSRGATLEEMLEELKRIRESEDV